MYNYKWDFKKIAVQNSLYSVNNFIYYKFITAFGIQYAKFAYKKDNLMITS